MGFNLQREMAWGKKERLSIVSQCYFSFTIYFNGSDCIDLSFTMYFNDSDTFNYKKMAYNNCLFFIFIRDGIEYSDELFEWFEIIPFFEKKWKS